MKKVEAGYSYDLVVLFVVILDKSKFGQVQSPGNLCCAVALIFAVFVRRPSCWRRSRNATWRCRGSANRTRSCRTCACTTGEAPRAAPPPAQDQVLKGGSCPGSVSTTYCNGLEALSTENMFRD